MSDMEKIIEILSRHKTLTFGDKTYDGIQFTMEDVINLLKAQKLNDSALENLEDMNLTIPCDEMSGENDWCEKHCNLAFNGATKECWKRYLTMV